MSAEVNDYMTSSIDARESTLLLQVGGPSRATFPLWARVSFWLCPKSNSWLTFKENTLNNRNEVSKLRKHHLRIPNTRAWVETPAYSLVLSSPQYFERPLKRQGQASLCAGLRNLSVFDFCPPQNQASTSGESWASFRLWRN